MAARPIPELDWFTTDLLPEGRQLMVIRRRNDGQEMARLDAATSHLLSTTLGTIACAVTPAAWPTLRQAVLEAFVKATR
jgi:hypothetical protein